jgi:hypothetical protein
MKILWKRSQNSAVRIQHEKQNSKNILESDCLETYMPSIPASGF